MWLKSKNAQEMAEHINHRKVEDLAETVHFERGTNSDHQTASKNYENTSKEYSCMVNCLL